MLNYFVVSLYRTDILVVCWCVVDRS